MTDLDQGASAVDAVFEAAYQAAERVTTHESLLDLKTRIIDWKGYQVDNFGELIMADQMKGLNYVDIGKDTAKTVSCCNPHTWHFLNIPLTAFISFTVLGVSV